MSFGSPITNHESHIRQPLVVTGAHENERPCRACDLSSSAVGAIMRCVTGTVAFSNRALASAWVRTGLLTGIVDGLWAIVLSVFFYGSTFARLWQGVASVPFGRDALQWGTTGTVVGILLHFCVAFGWSAVFLLLLTRMRVVRSMIAAPLGVIKVAAVYGPFIWAVMSLVVIPLLAQRPPTIGFRWWVQLLGHIPFVGLPIVACASRVARDSAFAISSAPSGAAR
jgi:hypothetical protein